MDKFRETDDLPRLNGVEAEMLFGLNKGGTPAACDHAVARGPGAGPRLGAQRSRRALGPAADAGGRARPLPWGARPRGHFPQHPAACSPTAGPRGPGMAEAPLPVTRETLQGAPHQGAARPAGPTSVARGVTAPGPQAGRGRAPGARTGG